MDVLFVDNGNSMVVAKLNIVEDDNMLFQGLDYYNYVTTNIETLSRIYNGANKYAISGKMGGKVFMHLSLRRDNFSVDTHNAEGQWTSYPVNSREDLEMLMALMKSNMENKPK